MMSGLLGLELLWLLAQSLRVVTDLLIMIYLHGIYSYNKYKQWWVVYFFKHQLGPGTVFNIFFKAIHTWFLFVLKTATYPHEDSLIV